MESGNDSGIWLQGPWFRLLARLWFRNAKQRGITVKIPGDAGVTKRHYRFPNLVETPWPGATTLAKLFEQSCHKYASRHMLGTRVLVSSETETTLDGRSFEKVTLGPYSWLSYGDVFKTVVNFASGLVAIGHQKGEKVAIFAETRAEWFIALQGCFRRNYTVVTIYASLGEEALVHSLNETEVSTVICDHKQLAKLLDLSHQLTTVRRIVYMKGDLRDHVPTSNSSCKLFQFLHVENLGQDAPIDPDLPTPEDMAVIMYTSGSTGMPKGVMMSHANVVATVAGVLNMVPQIDSKGIYLAYLPLAHILELIAEVTVFSAGAAVGYGSPLTLTDTSSKIKKGTKGDASELKPTLVTAVPAILDRVRDGVWKSIDSKGGLAKKLFELAYKRRLRAIEGSWLGAWGPEKLFWDMLVFRKVKSVLGGRVRWLLSAGAPVSADTQRFINICFGIPIGQAYGLTETCAGATLTEWDDTSVGLVGPPLPHCYIKLVDWEAGGYLTTDRPMPRGEIVVGGGSVTMGYFNNEEKTREDYKVDERGMRWFYTGDIGQFHSDGCLEIIDRKKDIVKLQHGEYVSLGKVESVLMASPYVDNIMIHADPFQSCCVALMTPSQTALEKWAKGQYESFEDLCSKKEAIEEVLKSFSKVARDSKLQKFEIPAKIKLLSEPWTPESGLVTAALKLKRENIRKAFANELKQLYG